MHLIQLSWIQIYKTMMLGSSCPQKRSSLLVSHFIHIINVCVNAKPIYPGKKMLNALRYMADEMDSMYPHLLS